MGKYKKNIKIGNVKDMCFCKRVFTYVGLFILFNNITSYGTIGDVNTPKYVIVLKNFIENNRNCCCVGCCKDFTELEDEAKNFDEYFMEEGTNMLKVSKLYKDNETTIMEQSEEINKLKNEIKEISDNISNLEKEITEKEKTLSSKKKEIVKKTNESQQVEKIFKEKEDLAKEKQNEFENQEVEICDIKNSLNNMEKNTKENSEKIEERKKKVTELKKDLVSSEIDASVKEKQDFYNKNNAAIRQKISCLFDGGGVNIENKKIDIANNSLTGDTSICFIPFMFSFKGISNLNKICIESFKADAGGYTKKNTINYVIRNCFESFSCKDRLKNKIIDIRTLKRIWASVHAKTENVNNNGFEFSVYKNVNDEAPAKGNERGNNCVVKIKNCFYNKDLTICPLWGDFYNGDFLSKKVQDYNGGECDSTIEEVIRIDYGNFINIISVDDYSTNKNTRDNCFLLPVDFSDPEHIALLEYVGKGNYGVVVKVLMLEDGKWVCKAMKFTCSNSEYDASSKDNIKKELIAGGVAHLMGLDSLVYVERYGTIEKFVKRDENREKKVVNLIYDRLPAVLNRYFLQNNYEWFPDDKKNIKNRFENNVFKNNGKIERVLYFMVMKYINGEDLFASINNHNIDNLNIEELNKLGDMLSKLLIRSYIMCVALRDIKLKNIMKDKKGNFFVIDLQSLELDNNDLTDCFGTPEYWPLVKAMDIYSKKKEEDLKFNPKDQIYNTYVDSTHNRNFVDMYSSCTAMYTYAFKRLPATGLLILLFKYLVLDNDKYKNFNNDINTLISYLKDYKTHYENYVHNKNNNKKQNDVDKYFFEEVDDRNLSAEQKKKLEQYLAKFIKYVNNKKDKKVKFDIDDKELDEKLKDIKDNNINNITDEILEAIYNFYTEMVGGDCKNFTELKEQSCKYADLIKHILCMGSCLSYKYSDNKLLNMKEDVDDELKLVDDIDNIDINNKEKVFFDNKSYKYIDDNIIKELNDCYDTNYIKVLLSEVPLKNYYKLSKALTKGAIRRYARNVVKNKNDDDKIKNDDNGINRIMKTFYLLKYLDNEKLLYVPVDITKSLKLIGSPIVK